MDAGHPRRDHSSPDILGSGYLTLSSFQSLGCMGPVKALVCGHLLICQMCFLRQGKNDM